MKRKPQVLAIEEELLVDLTFHNIPASLLREFAEKIVNPLLPGQPERGRSGHSPESPG